MDVMQAAAEREAQGTTSSTWRWASPARRRRARRSRAAAALERETLGYTVALGLPALRERIARHYASAMAWPWSRSGWS